MVDLDTNGTHNLIETDTGQSVQIECVQKDTIGRSFTLWQDTQKQMQELEKKMVSRDNKIKEAFDEVTKSIDNLINEMDKRRYINNYTAKEKELLEKRVDGQEETEVHLFTKVGEIDTRLTTVESNLNNVINLAESTAQKYDRMFWLLLAFFILFIVKTFVWGY